jgi:uncharacterized protein YbjT (DUF2867 family)
MTSRARRRNAVIAGATGLVGAELLARVLREATYARFIALARRSLPPADRLDVVEADFDRLDHVLRGASAGAGSVDVFCCLGTTIARAGSQEAFRRVDHDYVLALGRWAAGVGARRMIAVSALGADPASRVFYNRVKGETERDLEALGLASLVIVRPSLLDGARGEFRLGERIALAASRPFRRLLPAAARPIAAADVAAAMLAAALIDDPPQVLTSAAMQGAARLG